MRERLVSLLFCTHEKTHAVNTQFFNNVFSDIMHRSKARKKKNQLTTIFSEGGTEESLARLPTDQKKVWSVPVLLTASQPDIKGRIRKVD